MSKTSPDQMLLVLIIIAFQFTDTRYPITFCKHQLKAFNEITIQS